MLLQYSFVLLLCNAIPGIISAASISDDISDFEEGDLRINLLQSEIVQENNERLQTNSKKRRTSELELENWTGLWFPEKDPINYKHSSYSMQIIVPGCDDGKTNLTIDWDKSETDYTCSTRKIIPDYQIRPQKFCENIPEEYNAAHICMSSTIEYSEDIPVYGAHRPVWPVYGTYRFLPRQRWLHSLEHGGVVMLYHPCANKQEVEDLKNLVKNCLRRHIISPYDLLSEQRPLALVTWGCHLTMSYVDSKIVKNFIRKKALRGPELIPEDGLFEEELIEKPITSVDSISDLCLDTDKLETSSI